MGDEIRDPERYDKEVAEYLVKARARPDLAIAPSLIRSKRAACLLEVENLTQDNFAQVAVDVEIEGDVSAYFTVEDIRVFEDEKPSRPTPWGSRTRYDPRHLLSTHALNPPPRPGWTYNERSTRIRFAEFDLRPLHRRWLPAVHIVNLAETVAGELVATWSATSTSVSGVASGELRLPLDAPADPRNLSASHDEEED